MANYTIIGGDGKQYGPVSDEELRRWIADHRAHAQTKVQAEGAAEWKSLSEYPEFAGSFKNTAPPQLPAATSAAAPLAKTSGMAVTSLVLGILGFVTCGITIILSAPVGLILGIVSLIKIGKSQGQLRGKGLALAGIITSGAAIVLIPLFAAMLLPALAAAKQKATEINCVNNEKQLAQAEMMYSQDNTNHFPPSATWCDAIQKEIGGQEQVFKCPTATFDNRCSYAINAKLDGLPVSAVSQPATTVLIFESDGGWNASGGRELLPAKARHGSRSASRSVINVAFADGHVESVPQSRLNTLRWDP